MFGGRCVAFSLVGTLLRLGIGYGGADRKSIKLLIVPEMTRFLVHWTLSFFFYFLFLNVRLLSLGFLDRLNPIHVSNCGL